MPEPDPFVAVDGGVVLHLRVQPGARQSVVVGRHGDALKVKVAAPPVEGKANAAVVALVAAVLRVRVGQVEVLAGPMSRTKRVKVVGVTIDQVREVLGAMGAL